MNITLHGAAYQVGRSCIEIKSKDKRFLLDSGIEIADEPAFPTPIDRINEINAVFLSHGHLDHSGALPLNVAHGLDCPIFCTSLSKTTADYLLRDSLKIAHLKKIFTEYNKTHIKRTLELMQKVTFKKDYNQKNIQFKMFDSGHIPGGCSQFINCDGKTILYTSDIKIEDSRLLKGADTNYPKTDIMISEATYGDRNHPNRQSEEERFLAEIESGLEKNEPVLIPAFAVGRAQEVLLILNQKKFSAPIYLDGMAKEMTNIYQEYPENVRNIKELKNAVRKVKYIKSNKERDEALKTPGIFITTAGMLTGGPVIEYLKQMWFKTEGKILLTGYQGEHTNGRLLLDEGRVFIDGHKVKVNCKVCQFDFSAHAGMDELHNLIVKTNPRHLILQHGDPKAIDALQKWALENTKAEVHVPKLYETVNIN